MQDNVLLITNQTLFLPQLNRETLLTNDFNLVAIRIFYKIIIRRIARKAFWICHFIAFGLVLSV